MVIERVLLTVSLNKGVEDIVWLKNIYIYNNQSKLLEHIWLTNALFVSNSTIS